MPIWLELPRTTSWKKRIKIKIRNFCTRPSRSIKLRVCSNCQHFNVLSTGGARETWSRTRTEHTLLTDQGNEGMSNTLWMSYFIQKYLIDVSFYPEKYYSSQKHLMNVLIQQELSCGCLILARNILRMSCFSQKHLMDIFFSHLVL